MNHATESEAWCVLGYFLAGGLSVPMLKEALGKDGEICNEPAAQA